MIGLLALASAAVFFGAAVYINLAEQPARLKLGDAAALAQWMPAYKRGCDAGLPGPPVRRAWYRRLVSTVNVLWLLGAGLILATWPYTLIVIMPVNRRLEDAIKSGTSGEARALLIRWGRLCRTQSSERDGCHRLSRRCDLIHTVEVVVRFAVAQFRFAPSAGLGEM